MSYVLGVDLGTTFTAAAVCRKSGGGWGKVEVLPLGSRSSSTSSVLFFGTDGTVLVGEAAERRALTVPEGVAREFKRRIGDRTPMLLAGQPHTAHALAARLARWVVDRTAEREGGLPDRLAITHPAGWGEHKKGLLAEALDDEGLGDAVLLSEPEAAAFEYSSIERVEAGSTVAVYDLGGGTFDAAVLRKIDDVRFELLGEPAGVERLGGVDFDDAVFGHLRGAFAEGLGDLVPDDEVAMSAAARLRRECTEAKEALSTDTEVTIPVLLPGVQSQARMTRGEFEALIRPALEDTVELLRSTIRSASLTEADVDAVLLIGGSSRIPLVSQLLSQQLGRAVVVDCDPKSTVAQGAARTVVPVEKATAPVVSSATQPPARPEVENIPLVLPRPEPRRRLLRPKVLVGATVLAVSGIAALSAITVDITPDSLESSSSSSPAAQAASPQQPQAQPQQSPVAQRQDRSNPTVAQTKRKAGPNIPDEGLTSNASTATPAPAAGTSTPDSSGTPLGILQSPSNTQQDPTATTQDPTATTQDPTATTQNPPPATQDPLPTTQDPTPTTQDPPPPTEAPPLTTVGPPATTQDPTPTTQDPPPTSAQMT
ncbi:Hsp70 family protein [Lentzea sp.]|uniref:Hsp70 family protein n=1 Tax=Lentzea sp. TaxID=56099 RepID=UPI002ED25D10